MRDFRPVVEFQFGQAARKQSPPGTFTQDQGAVGQIDSADGSLSAPEKLDLSHDLSRFQCGDPALDEWLRRRALRNEESGASRTYVICVERQVVGYYVLAAGAVAHADAPGRFRRNTPTGRLPADSDFIEPAERFGTDFQLIATPVVACSLVLVPKSWPCHRPNLASRIVKCREKHKSAEFDAINRML